MFPIEFDPRAPDSLAISSCVCFSCCSKLDIPVTLLPLLPLEELMKGRAEALFVGNDPVEGLFQVDWGSGGGVVVFMEVGLVAEIVEVLAVAGIELFLLENELMKSSRSISLALLLVVSDATGTTGG